MCEAGTILKAFKETDMMATARNLVSLFSVFVMFFIFKNPALAMLGQGLKKSPIGQKLDFANHPYLCKGLIKF
jgi:hypothetical protein